MSAAAYLVIRCDGCGDREAGTPFEARNHREVRAHNKQAGWRWKRGRDLCPVCAVTDGFDRSRRYLVAVAPFDGDGELAHQHLAVLGWNPRVKTWVHGQAICGRSVPQGPVEPGGDRCPDCQARAAEYTLILDGAA